MSLVSRHDTLNIYFIYESCIWSLTLTERPASGMPHDSNGLRNHVHLLEADQSITVRLVAFMSKGHVFEDERHERDHGWWHFVQCHAIRTVVPWWIDETLKFRENFSRFRRQSFPSLTQSRQSNIPETHHDRKESVQVLILLTTAEWKRGQCNKSNRGKVRKEMTIFTDSSLRKCAQFYQENSSTRKAILFKKNFFTMQQKDLLNDFRVFSFLLYLHTKSCECASLPFTIKAYTNILLLSEWKYC